MTDEKRNLRYLYGLIGKESGPNPIFLIGHPIGSVYITTNNDESTAAQVATKYGGTWVAWGSGKVPVGVDSAQTEFDTAEKTGGEKKHALTSAENGPHTHTGGNHYHGVEAGSYYAYASGTVSNETVGSISGSGWKMPQVPESGTWTGSNKTGLGGVVATTSSGSGTAHNNLQPYITCYMWKRTA